MKAANRATFVGAIAASAITIVFCLLLLARDPQFFWKDDYQISVLPVCADMARAWSHGQFPLLSPYSWVCGNLASEFQYGAFSAFINALIVAIWKFSLTFPQQAAALSIAHLAVLAPGAFLLARDRNLSAPNALLVALVGALNGWIICWGATDWLGALGAFTWLPWAWWAGERALDPRRSRWRFLWPAPFVYLLVTGGFPYTVLMLALVFAWMSVRALVRSRRLISVLPLAIGSVLGIGLGAPAWLALLDYVQGSARAVQNPAEHFQWLVPLAAWPGLILPSWTVPWSDFSSQPVRHAAMELASGVVPPAALLAGLIAQPRALLKKIRWEFVLLSLVFALAMMPTAGMFRWSFRWLPLFHLVLALCAGEALELLGKAPGVWLRPGVLAVILFAIVSLSAHAFHLSSGNAFPFLLLFGAILLLWAAIELSPRPFLRLWAPPYVAFGALLATYFCLPTNGGVPKFDLPESLRAAAPLDPRHLYLSVYPPPEFAYNMAQRTGPVGPTVRPGSVSMWAGVRFVNGYSPIGPAGVARAFGASIHGEIDEGTAKWLLENEATDAGLLARLGVDGIIVANEFTFDPQPAAEWEKVVRTQEGRVFHRESGVIAQVRSVDWDGEHAIAGVDDIVISRNWASASVDVPAGKDPAMIAFSRPFFRGYVASLDGRNLPVTSYRGLIPVVNLSAGVRGRLTLTYRPDWLVCGTGTAALCALLWIGSATFALRANVSRRHQ